MSDEVNYLQADSTMFLNALSASVFAVSSAHGFWPPEGRNFGEIIALTTSELSEALEAHRDDLPAYYEIHDQSCASIAYASPAGSCTCHPKPEGAAVELIDTLIRVLDAFNHPDIQGVDIDGILLKKMLYNASRPFKHGRSY